MEPRKPRAGQAITAQEFDELSDEQLLRLVPKAYRDQFPGTPRRCLLGQPAGADQVPANAVPARTPDLSGLPPTFIAVGSIDLFVRESLEYAQRLIDADVPVDLHVVAGAFHAFDAVAPQAAISRTFRSTLIGALARGWNTTIAT